MKKNTHTISIYKLTGSFAEDKDIAKNIRINTLWPNIKKKVKTEVDFKKVDDATQSFIHALISDLIRETQGEVLDIIYFKNCNQTVKKIINIVVDYMLEY